MSPGFLSSKFFDGRIFSKHRTDHVQCFSALWDKRFPTENSDFLFLCERCFVTRIFLKHGRGPIRIFFRYCETKTWKKSRDKPPLLSSINFFNTRSLLNQRRVPYEIFRYCEIKTFKKMEIQTPLPLSIKFFLSENFWNTEGWPYEFFWYCETKIWKKNPDKPLLLLSKKICETGNFSETPKCFPTNSFGTVRKKIINRNYWKPLIVRKFFRKPFFSETEKACHTRFFGTVRHRLWQKIVIHTPLL